MKASRVTLALAVPAAALFALAGCFQLPIPGPGPQPQTQEPDPNTPADLGSQLAGTSWSGTDDADNTMAFTFNGDGTVDFSDWNGDGPFDFEADVWSVSGTEITFVVTDIEMDDGTITDLTYTGPAQLETMTLQGSTGAATTTLTITQE